MVRAGKTDYVFKTVAELYNKFIGKKGLLTVRQVPVYNPDKPEGLGLTIPVFITDARGLFGRHDVHVQARNGTGSVWVDSKCVTIVEEWPLATTEITTTPRPAEPPSIDISGTDPLA